MEGYVFSQEQKEVFDESVKRLRLRLVSSGEEEIDIVPDRIYLDVNGHWSVASHGKRKPLDSLEKIIAEFSKNKDIGARTQEYLYDVLIEYMEIDENYLSLFSE